MSEAIREVHSGHSARPATKRSTFRIGHGGGDVVVIDHRQELDQDWLDDFQRLAESLHDLCATHGSIVRIQAGPHTKILTEPAIEHEDDGA